MTKLRFTKDFGQKQYVSECQMAKVQKIMKMRMNMTDLKANFKGKYQDLMCVACKEEIETTEHVIQCEEYRKLTGHSLTQPALWDDLEWQVKACEVYEEIEEVRKWIL